MSIFLTGIQQAGIGTDDAKEAALYYRNLFGFDTLLFDDTAEATLMKTYTGNKVYKRRALLTMNMQGGGGLELWQYLNRKPLRRHTEVQPGDFGIYALKLKCENIHAAHHFLTAQTEVTVGPISPAIDRNLHFWVTDKYGHHFEIVQAKTLFAKTRHVCGGICGAVIGVGDMQAAQKFYKGFLGLTNELYNHQTNGFHNSCRSNTYHVVGLHKTENKTGPFCNLLGNIEIDLVKAETYQGSKIYADRYWGDTGFIHLCFDVINMEGLKQAASSNGYHFTVDSKNSFAMENAGGRFCYVEDPSGTLIELVETHQVPIVKKWGWYLHLNKRKGNKPLPNWMVKLMGLNKLR